MKEIKLVETTADYLEKIEDYRRELLRFGPEGGCRSLRRVESASEWLDWVERYRNLESNTHHFLAVRENDGKIVGILQLHWIMSQWMAQYAGNIGYSVRPSERRKGYATAMLHEALLLCREKGMEKVLVVCREDNEASRKTIWANGGVYDTTVTVPESGERHERYWISLQ